MSDSQFDTNLKTLKDAQVAADPLTQAKHRLAPVLADAQQAIKDFRMLVAQLMPEIQAASAAQAAAATVSVRLPQMDAALAEIGRLVGGGESGLKAVVEMIEGLTLYQAGQNRFMHDLESGSLLRQYTAVSGSLRGLVSRLPILTEELERIVAAAAARPVFHQGPQGGPSILEQAAAQVPSRPDGPGLV